MKNNILLLVDSWAASIKTATLFLWQKIAKPVALWGLKMFRKVISLDEYYEKDRLAYAQKATTYEQILEIFEDLKFLVACKSVQKDGTKAYKFRRREPGDKRKLWITGHSLGIYL